MPQFKPTANAKQGLKKRDAAGMAKRKAAEKERKATPKEKKRMSGPGPFHDVGDAEGAGQREATGSSS